jgi:hypothetical protein
LLFNKLILLLVFFDVGEPMLLIEIGAEDDGLEFVRERVGIEVEELVFLEKRFISASSSLTGWTFWTGRKTP